MNEPANFADGSVYGACVAEQLPYLPRTRAPLHAHSLCREARHRAGAHSDVHSLYGMAEAQATN